MGSHPQRALVLFFDAHGLRDLHFVRCGDHRLPADSGRPGDRHQAIGQRSSHQWFLFDCADFPGGAVRAIPVFAAAPLEQHGRVAGGLSRRADRGARRTVVFDGPGAKAFPLAARNQVSGVVDGKRDCDGAGVLGGAGDHRAFLGALPGAPGFTRHFFARALFCPQCQRGHWFTSSGEPRDSQRGSAPPKFAEHGAHGVPDITRAHRRRIDFTFAFLRRDSWGSRGFRRFAPIFQRQPAALGRRNFPAGGLPAVCGFD